MSKVKTAAYWILAVAFTILILGGYLVGINVLFACFPSGLIAHFFNEKFTRILTIWTGDPIIILATLGKWGVPIVIIMAVVLFFTLRAKRGKR